MINPNWPNSVAISVAFVTLSARGCSSVCGRLAAPVHRVCFNYYCYRLIDQFNFPTIQGFQMEGRFAEELYAESLEISKSELKSTSAHDQENKLHECDDDDFWGDSDDKLDKSSDLDREWQRRHDEFHTIGYREGLIAGKEASSQEGFNIGFKQSVLAGYSWGAVRGVTSAFAHLPDELKEKLVEKLEKRNELHGMHESVHSVSTADALRFFHEDIKAKEALEQSKDVKVSPWQTSHVSHLRNYHQQLESLIHDTPTMDIHLPEPK